MNTIVCSAASGKYERARRPIQQEQAVAITNVVVVAAQNIRCERWSEDIFMNLVRLPFISMNIKCLRIQPTNVEREDDGDIERPRRDLHSVCAHITYTGTRTHDDNCNTPAVAALIRNAEYK